MDSDSSRHRRRQCPHCNEFLSYSAFRSHKSLYYIASEQRWVANQPTPDNEPCVAVIEDQSADDLLSFQSGIAILVFYGTG